MGEITAVDIVYHPCCPDWQQFIDKMVFSLFP